MTKTIELTNGMTFEEMRNNHAFSDRDVLESALFAVTRFSKETEEDLLTKVTRLSKNESFMTELQHVAETFLELEYEEYVLNFVAPAVENEKMYVMPNKEDSFMREKFSDVLEEQELERLIENYKFVNICTHITFIQQELSKYRQLKELAEDNLTSQMVQ